jgi:hypothetical protein
MKWLLVAGLVGIAAWTLPACAEDPCAVALVQVPLHPSAQERIGLRLTGGVFGPGAGRAVARATVHSGVIDLDVVQTRDAAAFAGYHAIGDVVLDVFATVGPLAAGVYPVRVSMSSFVDGVTNIPCPAFVASIQVGETRGAVQKMDVVEFYNAQRNRYQLGDSPAAIAAFDDGTNPGWVRTGQGFKAYAVGGSDGRGFAVIRFASLPPTGLDAYFWTASSRESTAVLRDETWQFQVSPFAMPYPDTLTGECPDGTTPVYRVFDPRTGDHRWTAERALQVELIREGWIAEGHGDVGVVMCAPLA